MRGAVLLLAAGEGARIGADGPKAFLELGGVTLLQRGARTANEAELVDALIVAAPSGFEDRALDEIDAVFPGETRVVTGGATRQASAAAALGVVADAHAAVLVHDAARALAPAALFDACMRELDECEAVCPALPVKDTIKETSGDRVVVTLDRAKLAAVQTPQGFRIDVYRRAHEAASRDGFEGTDDAALAERIDIAVRIVPGDDRNIKITTIHDLHIAQAFLEVTE